MSKYPNLELLEYKARCILQKERQEEAKKLREEPRLQMNFEADVFLQTWPHTCTGFDVTRAGEPMAGGDTITEEYTTVMHETTEDVYIVFFGDSPCYCVRNAKEKFFNNLKQEVPFLNHVYHGRWGMNCKQGHFHMPFFCR